MWKCYSKIHIMNQIYKKKEQQEGKKERSDEHGITPKPNQIFQAGSISLSIYFNKWIAV